MVQEKKGDVENPGFILAEIAHTTAQIQKLDATGQFMEDPTTPAQTDRVAFMPETHELLFLSGFLILGDPTQPGCMLQIARTPFKGSVAQPTKLDSRLYVSLYPSNTMQNLRVERTREEEVVDSIDCNKSAGVTRCTYTYGEMNQEVSADMVSSLFSTAAGACDAFRQIQ